MDPPGLLSLLTCIKGVFIMIYLLEFTRCSEAVSNCACTDIPPWPRTQPASPGCFEINHTFRYKCIDGYVRKAGTSNLIRCVRNNEWSKILLECIVNPLAEKPATTQRTSTTLSTSTMTPSFSSKSSETVYSELSSTVLPPQHSPEAPLETTALPQKNSTFPSSPPTPSVSSETKSLEPTSTVQPPQHFPDTPNTSIVSSSAPLTPESYATSSLSTSTTTYRSKLLDRTTPFSTSSPNSTSSTQQETQAVATEVIAPVTVGIIVLAVVGAIWLLYRRKSRSSSERNHNERHAAEESVLMQQKDIATHPSILNK